MRKLFVSVNKITDSSYNMPMGVFGCSDIDNEDYQLATNALHADEIPDACCDAKTHSELIAGLLNAFYGDYNVVDLTEQQVCDLGKVDVEKEIPHPSNTLIPFPF